MSNSIVIIGGGHAAAQLCAALAEAGQGARVHVVCEEPAHPYQRPPLSKSYLKNAGEALQLHRDDAWYAGKGITVHLDDAAVAIDRTARKVRLASGQELAYGQLVLATGSRARVLPALAQPLANVLSLRSAADAEAIRSRLQEKTGQLVVLGGGFIGLEVAATARHLGWEVRVLEAMPRLLSRSASPELSAQILEHHRSQGTQVELEAKVSDFRAESGRLAALRVNSEEVAVDQLLLGIGAMPETRLAQEAGLAVENGIVVDAALRTSDPDILAIGDCSSFPYRGQHVRLESVQNANDQGKAAAATLQGQPANYAPVPWFWSDQGGLRLQMVGLWRPGLQAVRRPGATPASFSLFHYDGADLVAVESANAPMDHMMARKILEAGKSPAAAQVADPAIQLKTLLT
ncbi:FAD-dependent oxidoreductase [Ramlibacter sp. G-1-2-2]|uniref:FAD-dependent oxidoreductase n=1 Tax=Ramlibacter agri TaxID=2728837 RepID=A0A848H811_9BURK|nr:FAD-dependent oxidoreductase [Ramlibacter agri]NML47126.1 FAD-dependent oxidoreductase [Ramlibacter agri]